MKRFRPQESEISPGSDPFLTVVSLLNQTTEFFTRHGLETPRLDAEVLLTYVLQTDKTGLYLAYDHLVPEPAQEQLRQLILRRIRGEPVSYLIQRKEFWSLSFRVGPGVMVPRPQTETLVEAALEIFPAGSHPSVLEIGTGSGAIAVALARERPQARILAMDISSAALAIARENAATNRATAIQFQEGDLYQSLAGGGENFDLIISNPPYIPKGDIPRLPAGIRDYEPHLALDGGDDGLDCYRKVIRGAPDYLQSGGWLLLEVGAGQSQDVRAIFSETGRFSEPRTRKDLLQIERVVMAFRI